MAAGGKKQLNRPAKRKLVRWDENLNEMLLLTVQSVCNREGVKIPWAEVGKTMSGDISEGAIVQHLAKMRTRRVQSNKPVPPPLRRGGSGSATSSSSLVSSFKSCETPATSPRAPKEEQIQKAKPSTKTKKRASIDEVPIETYDDDDDEDWEPLQLKKGSKKKSPGTQKKRKTANLTDDQVLVKDENDEEMRSDTEMRSPDTDILAADAPFLHFLEGEEENQMRSVVLTANEEEPEDEDQETKSLLITLKPGKERLCKVKYKGIGLYHDRDPERRWELPPPGPEGEKWGFSKDYFGPVPTGYHDTQNPGLLRGQWPPDVVMRQYNAPRALAWAGETHDPDPRIVHPATWLDDDEADPQLKFHRGMTTAEQTNPVARSVDKDDKLYNLYANKHRELPTYYDPTWNTAPTISVQEGDDSTYGMYNFTDGTSVPAHEGQIRRHSDFKSLLMAHPQEGKDPCPVAMIDRKWTSTINDEEIPNGDMPPGRIYDLDQMLSNDMIDEANNLSWWTT